MKKENISSRYRFLKATLKATRGDKDMARDILTGPKIFVNQPRRWRRPVPVLKTPSEAWEIDPQKTITMVRKSAVLRRRPAFY